MLLHATLSSFDIRHWAHPTIVGAEREPSRFAARGPGVNRSKCHRTGFRARAADAERPRSAMTICGCARPARVRMGRSHRPTGWTRDVVVPWQARDFLAMIWV